MFFQLIAPHHLSPAILILASFHYITSAQLFETECNNFNSTATISPAQAEAAGINDVTASNAVVALQYERSNYAFGSVDDDDFYKVPPDSSNAKAGTLLKVEVDTNTSAYTLPPNTALSRILFQSENINGSVVPGSAYVLWPYMPRTQPDGWPVVAWAHGTSGIFGNCAPSHIRYLVYEFGAPYALALQGYVVVAPDYSGLGVDKYANGTSFVHPVLANPVLANDLIYSVQAAQAAFSQLSNHFVVMGHSEGGGAAFAAAQRQAVKPVSGYLGSIAGSPVTRILDAPIGSSGDAFALSLAPGLSSIFAGFDLSDLLTPAGENLAALFAEIQGCNAVGSAIQLQPDLAKVGWPGSFYVQAWQNLTMNGGQEISGPLLVLQGEADPVIPFVTTTAGVNSTCRLFPKSQLEYVTFANVTHVPVLFASQQIWLGWIEDRFAGKKVSEGCHTSRFESARPYQYYASEFTWFLEYSTQAYELA